MKIFPAQKQANVYKFKDAQFTFSPNPANNVINLKASKTISGIDVFNVMGQKVFSKSINAFNSSLDISQLDKGIYIMNVTIDGNTGTYRFIKE